MAHVLHLVKGERALAAVTIARQAAAGDDVTVALLQGAAAPDVPAGVAVRRVPEDVDYPQLVDLVFAADHVVTW
jgi:hypothetical protein